MHQGRRKAGGGMGRALRALLLVALAGTGGRAAALQKTTVTYVPAVAADRVKHSMDVHRPDGAKGAPLVIFFHGGVWQVGDRKDYVNVGEALASQGVVAAVASYRLTPQVTHPGHIQDAAAAVAYAFKHAQEWGADPSRIFLMGHSAGGQLITLLLMDPSWLKAQGVDAESLAGVIPLSGVFDLTQPLSDDADGGLPAFVHRPFGRDPKVLAAASPALRVRPTKVPILNILAGEDYAAMARQSSRFVAALQEHHVMVEAKVAKGQGHFELVSSMGSRQDQVTPWVVAFLQTTHARVKP